MNKGKYKARMKLLTLVRLGFVVMFVGCVGVSIVMIRNKHVLKGDEISRVEGGIADLSREIEMWELRIASVKDRNELRRRLKWMGSNLRGIEIDGVLRLRADDGLQAPVAGVF